VNVYGCIHLPDVGPLLRVVEYLKSGLIVKEYPRTGDQNIIDEEKQLKV